MHEWTINIDSATGIATDDSALEQFLDALEQEPEIRGPAAAINLETGVLSATFTVETETDSASRAASYSGMLVEQALRERRLTVPLAHLDVTLETADVSAA